MVKVLRNPDKDVTRVVRSLEKFEQTHPNAQCVVYRYNPAAIRVKIVDSVFSGRNKAERHDYAMKFLRGLPEDVFSQLSLLLCLEPGESSLMDLEFLDPTASSL